MSLELMCERRRRASHTVLSTCRPLHAYHAVVPTCRLLHAQNGRGKKVMCVTCEDRHHGSMGYATTCFSQDGRHHSIGYITT